MLKIKNLKVSSEKKPILNGINLSLRRGEVHFIMGPNGAGKSTLGLALMGHPNYKVDSGSVVFQGKKMTGLSADQISKKGIFLAFQHPLEFEGIKFFSFLMACLAPKLNPVAAGQEMLSNFGRLGISEEYAGRYLNLGFSGGEKKKSEMLQLLMMKPKVAILDEIDSGLDIDSLKSAARAINLMKRKNKTSFLVITHHSKISNFIKPDFVHIMVRGRIKKTGGKELIKRIDKYGYKEF